MKKVQRVLITLSSVFFLTSLTYGQLNGFNPRDFFRNEDVRNNGQPVDQFRDERGRGNNAIAPGRRNNRRTNNRPQLNQNQIKTRITNHVKNLFKVKEGDFSVQLTNDNKAVVTFFEGVDVSIPMGTRNRSGNFVELDRTKKLKSTGKLQFVSFDAYDTAFSGVLNKMHPSVDFIKANAHEFSRISVLNPEVAQQFVEAGGGDIGVMVQFDRNGTNPQIALVANTADGSRAGNAALITNAGFQREGGFGGRLQKVMMVKANNLPNQERMAVNKLTANLKEAGFTNSEIGKVLTTPNVEKVITKPFGVKTLTAMAHNDASAYDLSNFISESNTVEIFSNANAASAIHTFAQEGESTGKIKSIVKNKNVLAGFSDPATNKGQGLSFLVQAGATSKQIKKIAAQFYGPKAAEKMPQIKSRNDGQIFLSRLKTDKPAAQKAVHTPLNARIVKAISNGNPLAANTLILQKLGVGSPSKATSKGFLINTLAVNGRAVKSVGEIRVSNTKTDQGAITKFSGNLMQLLEARSPQNESNGELVKQITDFAEAHNIDLTNAVATVGINDQHMYLQDLRDDDILSRFFGLTTTP